jgi:GDP-L-fucose synthase
VLLALSDASCVIVSARKLSHKFPVSKFQNKKILVCGATGFIGRNLVERLAARGDCEVIAVEHNRPRYAIDGVEWLSADLTRAEDVDRVVAGADIIVQAAATTSGSKDIVTQPFIHTTDNAVMNSLLLRAAYTHGVGHFFFFSCTIMYQSADHPLRESDFDPSTELLPAYFGAGWTKLYIERMCEFYARISDCRFTVMRHSNIYGPHDKFDLERSHVFGATVTKVLSAPEGGNIVIWGTGEEGRDLVYVDDLADFIEAAVEHQQEAYGLFNVGAGEAIKIKDLVHRIVAASGKTLEISHDLEKPTIPTTFAIESSRAKEAVGWEASTALDDGIARTIDWWRQNIGDDQR